MKTDITPQEIAVRAYERFVARGYGHGSDVEDWLAAEAELRAQSTSARSTKTVRKPTRAPKTTKR